MTNIVILSMVLSTNWGLVQLDVPQTNNNPLSPCWRQAGDVVRMTELGVSVRLGTNSSRPATNYPIGKLATRVGYIWRTNGVSGPVEGENDE